MKSKNLLLLAGILFSAALLLNGCVSLPRRETLAVYGIDGVAYFPLISFCEMRNINWQYDAVTKSVVLSKDAHRVSLRVGDTLALVDGKEERLTHPVELYTGIVVAPYRFKEEVLDNLFKEYRPSYGAALPLTNIRKIVVDAGHGGADPGAVGRSGLREKEVNLDIARRLTRLLSAEGAEVVMTRPNDRFIPLSRRVDIANDSGADVFISIHSNANRVRSLNGFEVYYVATSVSDSKRAYSAAQHARLKLDSSCFATNSSVLKAILWDMVYTYNRAESIELSRAICRSMNDNLDIRILGVKGARFEVLRGVRMPAVLIETGFLSNSNEERMLKSSNYRQKVAEAIVEGINGYARGLKMAEARE